MVGELDGQADAAFVPTLGDLVNAAVDRGTNVTDLADAAGVNRSWIYKMRDNEVRGFPDVENVEPFARVLGVRIETLLLAYAKSLGLPLRQGGSRLASLLPAEAAKLNEKQVEALVQVIRAMVPTDAEVIVPVRPARKRRSAVDHIPLAASKGTSKGRAVRESQDSDAEAPDA